MDKKVDAEKRHFDDARYKLLGSFLDFTRFFFKEKNHEKFRLSNPDGRDSHFVEIAKALTLVLKGKINRLMINVPPGYGKSEMLVNFVAWTLARYPDSRFIYVSYAKTLAQEQTSKIRQILQHPWYRRYYGIELLNDSQAKFHFKTSKGGSVYAAGAGGTITGLDAGKQNVNRFSGAIIIDDIHKPNEAASDKIRQSINDWYFNTLLSRRRGGEKTPLIFIGQRVHEDDLAAQLLEGKDGYDWHQVILPSLDEEDRPLYPELQSKEDLLNLKDKMPYVFSAQYQQTPIPAGGGLFKKDWFKLLDQEPNIIATFLTCDTAETANTYNDATVFSFWGVYNQEIGGVSINRKGLIWLDCVELWVEPKDLKQEFLYFYQQCMLHRIKPTSIYIEKKSTGSTLISVLNDTGSLNVIPIDRNKMSKSDRFIAIQHFISNGQVNFVRNGKHVDMCIEHMGKITANEMQRYDDIADTCADAVKLALIDNVIVGTSRETKDNVERFSKLYRTYGD